MDVLGEGPVLPGHHVERDRGGPAVAQPQNHAVAAGDRVPLDGLYVGPPRRGDPRAAHEPHPVADLVEVHDPGARRSHQASPTAPTTPATATTSRSAAPYPATATSSVATKTRTPTVARVRPTSRAARAGATR